MTERWNIIGRAYQTALRFYGMLAVAFSDAYLIYHKTLYENKNLQNRTEVEKITMGKIRDMFDTRFRDDRFVRTLSDFVEVYSELAKVTNFGQVYQNISSLASIWNNTFVEPLRDTLWRTSSEKIDLENKFSLLHYKQIANETCRTPLLIIYALINRHYILDLLPQISVVRNLLRQGFDIYATDWGTPSAYDKELTIGHYVNNYIDNSVDLIRELTQSDKVSLLGYCWGGDLALIYAALHPDKVKNIITLATPGDFDLDDGLLNRWVKSLNVDALVDTFGNVPSGLLNSAFVLRSPVDYLHKYPHFFEKPRDLESIMEFVATEIWLYDSPPVIGEIFRQFVKDCYQQNLLIKNQMEVADMRVDLKNIDMPFLNIVASMDDSVAPDSSKALNKTLGSADNSLIEFPSGHVGACIGSQAHRELWPKVGGWLKDRS